MAGIIETGKTPGAALNKGTKPGIKAIPDDPGETLEMGLELKHVGAAQKILRP